MPTIKFGPTLAMYWVIFMFLDKSFIKSIFSVADLTS